MEIDVQSFDIPRLITVYPDQAGIRWWTKAWFNNRSDGEAAVEITREKAFCFMAGEIVKDTMLEKYYPKQMQIYHQAIEQTREQLSSSLSEPITQQVPEPQLNL